jgi:ABC-2 type transport system ATP-binding protein
MAEMMVQVSQLTKHFGQVLALSNVSFGLERNEIVGLLGNNGAGKSTLMRILTTFLPATSGTAKVDGFDVLNQSMEVRKRIGYLPENIPLYPEMRVEEYLVYRAQLKGMDRSIRHGRIDEIIERCRITGVRKRLLGTLSKGFRQRVGLADALLADPKLLILDEPTDGLDPGQKQDALALLKELGRDRTILFSSHLLVEVEAIVDRVLILKRGHLAFNQRLAALERDQLMLVEAKGESGAIVGALRAVVASHPLETQSLEEGWVECSVRLPEGFDPRAEVARLLVERSLPLRRLDFRRRTLQDRWNEINNAEAFPSGGAPGAANRGKPQIVRVD